MEKCGREEQICDIDRDLTGLTAVKPGAGWSKDVSAAEIWDGSGSEFDRPEMKKAALHEADAALISGGMSHSLHGPVPVRCRCNFVKRRARGITGVA
ncbi:hypothetical protein [Rhizobium sp. J15]|uniref:hypothetical protein n=1 Tax=Rhizobium sp. J15 TaxID=2035450 RepID=UPI001596B379|nr:hypothetical protein [Rhizobium sp. J15]